MERWTVADAAQELNVSPKRVYDWVSRRKIKPVGIDSRGLFLYPETELLLAEAARRPATRWVRMLSRAHYLT
jgi:hypothetical protein